MSQVVPAQFMRAMALSLAVLAPPVMAQDAGFSDDLETGLDNILITPLDESDAAGFGAGGLTLEDLQNLPDDGYQQELQDITTELQQEVASASGARIRALDKLTGEVSDLAISVGGTAKFGRIDVFLGDCRSPKGNPSGDAYAYLVVHVEGMEAPAFSGWMVASSPALNAMDHQRYDIWPLSCMTS